MQLEQDTIAAISTPPGRGGIGIVRLSGPQALAIVRPLLQLASEPQPSSELQPGRTHFGHVLDQSGQVLDQCVVTYYAGPRSYTGENILELACHGAPVLLDAILRNCVALGARLARPGEFTQRAFFNRRLDLTQAEAVRDLIDAQTLHQARIATAQLGGSLSLAIAPAKDALVDLIAALEAGVDFAEDDLDLLPEREILSKLQQIELPLRNLASTFASGRIVREGFTLALAGAPNAGKSSLFNALLERERAIVTPEPGTTRDLITERFVLGGLPVTLVDTAGLRALPGSPAEAIGIERTHQAIAEADLVLLVSCGEQVSLPMLSPVRQLRVWTKADLAPPPGPGSGLPTSAHTGEGLAELRQAVLDALSIQPGEGGLITNLRQHQSLTNTVEALAKAQAALYAGTPHEMILLDLYAALAALDELTGHTGTEEILTRIFSEFCIGK